VKIDDGLETLSDEECRELLVAGTVGRIGVTMRGLPMIFPVNYAIVDGDIVFPILFGTSHFGAGTDAIVAFEVGAAAPPMWSVLAVGRATHVVSDDEHEALSDRSIPSWPLVRGSRFVRIRPELLTGVRSPTL
jgi:nitroimidazol reductase NimA-like FMN-containing flavoprotein (pyridoxamine 5'-phosphate oxidase superfamily)